MSFLPDTNVVSEWTRPQPDAGVLKWLADVDEDSSFLSVVTLAELRRGVVRLIEGRRRRQLREWLDQELPLRFEGRILPIDASVALAWGDVMAEREARGRPISSMNAFIAATARVHALTLVTRNVADFEPSLLDFINPWSA